MSFEDATNWFMRLQESHLAADTLEEWRNWISVRENRESFDRVERLWSALDRVARPDIPTSTDAAAESYEGSQSFGNWKAQRTVVRPRGGASLRYLRYGIAATVLISIAIGMLATDRWRQTRTADVAVFETAIAEHRSIVLSDGSRIQLAARSTVTASLNEHARTVVLNSGEALFDVARDPSRPFNVIAGGGTITALGTSFNVRKREDNYVVVTVTAGAVRVAPLAADTERNSTRPIPSKRLEQGQQISYDAKGRSNEPRLNADNSALSWRDGRLQYRHEPLRNVLSDVNRYSRRQILLGDGRAGELPFTGTVFERDVEAWIAVLHRTYPELEVTVTDPDKVLIRTRRLTTRE